MDYLVTGGAGFIGSNIVRRLVGEGRSVRVLDNLATGRKRNLAGRLDDIDFIEGDIRDEAAVARAVKEVEHVLHVGALPSVVRSVEDPATSDEVNIRGTLNVLTAARDAGVRRVVFSSSSSVYGDTKVLPKQEDMFPSPLSPYAVQKLTGEHYCRVFHSLYGLNAFVLRYFNVFGPRQNPASQYAAVVPLFISAFQRGEAPTIYGDGGQTRDFTYVDDVIEANLCCCRAADDAAGGIFNVARCERTSVNELATRIGAIMGTDIAPTHVPARAGDVRDSQGDNTRACGILGWKSTASLDAGLAKTIEYFTAASE